ncbi:MAG: ATP-binding protein [Paludibacteraceae bacterium]|nr:ATP-binding protein [Paludibacteraceae bacterium]
MTLDSLVRIVAEQKEEFLHEDLSELCPRFEEGQLSLTSNLAQVVIGVRRCGKSTLCLKFLMQSGIDCGYVSLDDERLNNLEAEDLNLLLEAMYIVYGNNIQYVFFDEIQNAKAWPLFVNRLLRQKKHVFVTGSNSKLLSNELMTHLTGRHHAVSLFPFSFREYCAYNHIDIEGQTTHAEAARIEALHKYLNAGGMPELLHESNRKQYITTLMHTIIRNDIARRFNVRNIDALHKVATYLCDNYGQEFVPSTVGKLFGLSTKTVANYFRYLKEAFLLIGVSKFSFQAKERTRNEKCYAVDVAFPQEHEGGFSLDNLGWKLENIVCVELLRRYSPESANVFYYKGRGFQCDFVIADGSRVKELIQVSYDVSSPKTRERELNGLRQTAKALRCNNLTLITFSSEEDICEEGMTIHVVSASDWLLH